MGPTVRRSVTLIELLVVLAILVISVGLPLPAVREARAAAPRVQCRNHLKELALAWRDHHAALGPAAATNRVTPPSGAPNCGCCSPHDRIEWSWACQILPFVEPETVHRRYGNTAAYRTPPKDMDCPTQRPATLDYDTATLDQHRGITPESTFLRRDASGPAWRQNGSYIGSAPGHAAAPDEGE